MDKHNYFFGEVLDEADVDQSFTRAEDGINARALDGRTPGVVTGCRLYAYALDNNSFSVEPGIVLGPEGERINIRTAGPDSVGGYVSVDSDGNPTDPGPGNYRWVTICARFGRTMLDPQTDDLANTIYTTLTDSWNAHGLDYMTDGTQSSNEASDGGFAVDNFGLSLNGFYVVAGPADTIGNPLTFASLPVDAVILADVLVSDGDIGSPLLDSNISYMRQQRSAALHTSPIAFPALGGEFDPQFPRTLLWEVPGTHTKCRAYAGPLGVEFVNNASWDSVAGLWTADDPGYDATRLTVQTYGLLLEQKHGPDSFTPWDDTFGLSGWDKNFLIGGGPQNGAAEIDMAGDFLGSAATTGYIALALGTNSTITSARTAIQFPRAFFSAPSSVTLGSPQSETNVSAVSTSNITQYGCTFKADVTSAAPFLAQRYYTATP